MTTQRVGSTTSGASPTSSTTGGRGLTPLTGGTGSGAPAADECAGWMMDEVSQRFAILFRGGKVAIDDPDEGGFRPWQSPSGGFIPADDKDFIVTCDDHLYRGPSIGVYPLFLSDSDFWVYWGCVDWDTGFDESHVHARNTQEVLRQLGVAAWVERSRSKGFHLWVFFEGAQPAVDVRHGLVAACDLVDAPTTEVNPKQVELSQRGWGNGVRLPYGHLRNPGGYNEVLAADGEPMPLAEFTTQAHATRPTTQAWEAVSALWKPPERPRRVIGGPTPTTDSLEGLAAFIRRLGPEPSPHKPTGDRSVALWKLACAMTRQGYTRTTMLRELSNADIEWGRKFANREDGEEQLGQLLDSAYKDVHQ